MEVKVNDEKLNKAAIQYAKESDDYGDLFSLLYNTFIAGAVWQYEQFRKIEKLGTEEREKTKLKAMTEEQREHISLVILGDVTTMRCDESVIYIDDFISYGQMAEIVDYLRKEE